MEDSSPFFKYINRWILKTLLKPRPHGILVEQIWTQIDANSDYAILFLGACDSFACTSLKDFLTIYISAQYISALPHRSSTSKIPIELLVKLYKFSARALCLRAPSELRIDCLLAVSSWASNSHQAGPLQWCFVFLNGTTIDPSVLARKSTPAPLLPYSIIKHSPRFYPLQMLWIHPFLSISIILSPKSHPFFSGYCKSP